MEVSPDEYMEHYDSHKRNEQKWGRLSAEGLGTSPSSMEESEEKMKRVIDAYIDTMSFYANAIANMTGQNLTQAKAKAVSDFIKNMERKGLLTSPYTQMMLSYGYTKIGLR